jgi:hypothetical protein
VLVEARMITAIVRMCLMAEIGFSLTSLVIEVSCSSAVELASGGGVSRVGRSSGQKC